MCSSSPLFSCCRWFRRSISSLDGHFFFCLLVYPMLLFLMSIFCPSVSLNILPNQLLLYRSFEISINVIYNTFLNIISIELNLNKNRFVWAKNSLVGIVFWLKISNIIYTIYNNYNFTQVKLKEWVSYTIFKFLCNLLA